VTDICFVANFSKTFLFESVAKELASNNFAVTWITVNRKLHGYLTENYGNDKVLLLNWLHKDIPAPAIGEFKLNELACGDRALRLSSADAKKYLVNIQEPIYSFLLRHKVRAVVGELTWAHEILIHRIVSCRAELNCRFLNPHTVRIPNGRFALFTDEYQTELITRAPEVDGEKLRCLEPEAAQLAKPDYLHINDQILQNSRSLGSRLGKIKRFITEENIEKEDPTNIGNRWYRLKLRMKEEINKELYRLVKRVPLEKLGSSSFVFVALHKQPEASIDVLGRYYEDQFLNIRNTWRVLPHDWLLVIKEHTNAIGDRPLSFYRKLQKLPGVVFVNEATDSHELIKRCRAVITVSGTVAYEATLMQKSSLTFAPVFFNRFPGCKKVSLDDLRLSKCIDELIEPVGVSRGDVLEWVHRHSFEGVISDPITMSSCLETENVRLIGKAIIECFRK